MMLRNPLRQLQERAFTAFLARLPVARRERLLSQILAGLPKAERERVLVSVPGFATFATSVMRMAAQSAERAAGVK